MTNIKTVEELAFYIDGWCDSLCNAFEIAMAEDHVDKDDIEIINIKLKVLVPILKSLDSIRKDEKHRNKG